MTSWTAIHQASLSFTLSLHDALPILRGKLHRVWLESWKGPDQVEIYRLALDFVLNMFFFFSVVLVPFIKGPIPSLWT